LYIWGNSPLILKENEKEINKKKEGESRNLTQLINEKSHVVK